jgi:hypothetical protein
MHAIATLLLALALAPHATALVPADPLGHWPDDWACDQHDLERRVCAGATTQVSAECSDLSIGIRCHYTYDWTHRAWGARAEAGREVHASRVVIETCSTSGSCREDVVVAGDDDCSWLPGLFCSLQFNSSDFQRTHRLAEEECATSTITSIAYVRANVETLTLALGPAQVEHSMIAQASGSACRLA